LLAAALGATAALAPLPGCRRAPAVEAPPGGSREWFAAPSGAADNEGSRERPLDLATALSAQSPVAPGDTVWLAGGTYTGAFTSYLTGTDNAPIVVRQIPGERAVIDGAGARANTLTVHGAHTWYWDFEVTNSDPERVFHREVDPDDPSSPNGVRGVGINVFGAYTRFINIVVHDTMGGFGLWEGAVDAEVYGAIVYHNGIVDTRRGHGHGLYIQNRTGTKRIVDIVSFGNHATGMKVYGEAGYATGVHFEGVASFDNGVASIDAGPDQKIENLLVGTIQHPADRISIVDSAFYHRPGVLATNVALGYRHPDNGEVTLENNLIIGGSVALAVRNWQSARAHGNILYAETSANPRTDQSLVQVRTAPGGTYDWDRNVYVDGTRQLLPFTFDGAVNRWGGGNLGWREWRESSSLDRASRYERGRPRGLVVKVRPNRYERGRAHVIVFNPDRASSAPVDLSSSGLQPGERYEVVDAQNYFGRAITTGVYDGQAITVPLTGLVVGAPVGRLLHRPVHTAPEFAVFVVRRTPVQ
jgi:hypothetical protein